MYRSSSMVQRAREIDSTENDVTICKKGVDVYCWHGGMSLVSDEKVSWKTWTGSPSNICIFHAYRKRSGRIHIKWKTSFIPGNGIQKVVGGIVMFTCYFLEWLECWITPAQWGQCRVRVHDLKALMLVELTWWSFLCLLSTLSVSCHCPACIVF